MTPPSSVMTEMMCTQRIATARTAPSSGSIHNRVYNRPMIHEVLEVGPLACNCSIFGDEQTREGMVVDPGDDIAEILAVVKKHELTVKSIVITHAHIDHIGGAAKLKA